MPQQLKLPFYSILLQLFLFFTLVAPSLAASDAGRSLSDLPPADQAGISAAIGRNDTNYHLRKSAAGFRAEFGNGGLSALFTADGATIAKGTDSWSLKLAAFGREDSIKPVAPAVLASEANRVEYRRSALTEWYVNGPIGLEQGFTIPQRPSGAADRKVVITMAGAGLKPVAAGKDSLALVRADGSEAFRYGGLAAWDATGTVLPVQMALIGDQLTLKVDDRGARYPVTVDPVFSDAFLFMEDEGGASDHFGWSASLSSDGTTALIGAPDKAVNGNAGQGVVYVFTRLSLVAVWREQAQLTALDGVASDQFGRSVALSADGATALVGAYYKNIGANLHQGAAYIFTRSGTDWIQQAQLTAADGAANDSFGMSLALSRDGLTAIVGALKKMVGTNSEQGAAYVFSRSGNSWNPQATLTASDGATYDHFGFGLALSDDGSTALIGASNKYVEGNSNQGVAYIFTRSLTSWAQHPTPLVATDGAQNDYFGISVALNGTGTVALIGAYGKTIEGRLHQGAAYVFSLMWGTTWAQTAQLTASDGAAEDWFGSVALSSDGTSALIGAYRKKEGTYLVYEKGAAYIFTYASPSWSQQVRLDSDASNGNNWFGTAVALSADGTTALVGEPHVTVESNAEQGAAYISIGPGWTWPTKLTASFGEADDRFGYSVAISSDGSTALVGAYNKNNGYGAAYVYVRSGTGWIQQARLSPVDIDYYEHFGVSVSLSSDGNTALIGAYTKYVGANINQGAAYIYTRSGTIWTQQPALFASDGAANDYFGLSVTLSRDGNTALIGSTGTNSNRGSVYVYVRTGNSWGQQARLIATPNSYANDMFGNSVAVSSAGNTALIGALNNLSAYVFTRLGNVWTQEALLTPAVPVFYFGDSAALSSDGNTAIVGGCPPNGRGTAHIFSRSGSIWSEQAKLNASDPAPGDYFGYSTALSSDGNTALIGAYGNSSKKGTASLFIRTGSTWNFLSRITALDGAVSDEFGISVSISGDGKTALIGAHKNDVGTDVDEGTAYTFEMYPQRCIAGTYDNGTTCVPCASGSYQGMGLQTACIAAPAGYFVAGAGAASALSCTPGSYQDLTGQTGCKPCPVGSYQPSAGQSACIPAPPGFFVTTTGAATPQPCTAGTAKSTPGSGNCGGCDYGTYQPSPGQTACIPAPVGFFVPVRGASSPEPCASGTAQSLSGQTACTTCADGTVQPATGQAECVILPKAVNAVAFDPADLSMLYAGIDTAGVYISKDGGTTWSSATTQPANNRIKALVLLPGVPGDPTQQFAASYGGGVFTSKDSGDTWTACGNIGLTNLNVLTLSIESSKGTLYAGTEGGVFTSSDGCENWTAMNDGLPSK